MRKQGRRDGNHVAIVRELRQLGYSVLDLGSVGCGCPDILVGKDKRNWLLEIKDGNLAPSRRKLTPDEKAFHEQWRGQVATVETTAQAVAKLEELRSQ